MAATTKVSSAGSDPERSGANIIAEGPAMRHVVQLARRVSGSLISVLITGETGAGKEVVARLIHEASGRRNGFVPVNCAALPPALAESELFGHVRGAFTGAVESRKGLLVEADGGTLFLDEVGDMSTALQAKLLRVLDDGRVRPVGSSSAIAVDVRVLAATHRDLVKEVRSGRFREDLYHRLAGVPLKVPPLRERPEDIPALVEKFLAEAIGNRKRPQLPDDVLEWLQLHPWHGNVRELRQAVHRAVTLGGEALRPEDFQILDAPLSPTAARALNDDRSLPRRGRRGLDVPLSTVPRPPTWFDGKPLRDIERDVIARALARHDDCISAAARELGIARMTLLSKARTFGLRPPAGGKARAGQHG